MLGFLTKGLYRRMEEYCGRVQLATWRKLVRDLTPTYGENARKIAAAIATRVFGQQPDQEQADVDRALVEKLSREFVLNEQDVELFHGIVLALRTTMTIETARKNEDATSRIAETILWIKSIRPLPTDAPNPATMEILSTALRERYAPKPRGSL